MSKRDIQNLHSDLIVPDFPENSERAQRARARGEKGGESYSNMSDSKPSITESKGDISDKLGFNK